MCRKSNLADECRVNSDGSQISYNVMVRLRGVSTRLHAVGLQTIGWLSALDLIHLLWQTPGVAHQTYEIAVADGSVGSVIYPVNAYKSARVRTQTKNNPFGTRYEASYSFFGHGHYRAFRFCFGLFALIWVCQ